MYQGSDATLLIKMNQQHQKRKTYLASKSEYDTDFGIRHYAGVVYYDTNGTEALCNRFKSYSLQGA